MFGVHSNIHVRMMANNKIGGGLNLLSASAVRPSLHRVEGVAGVQV